MINVKIRSISPEVSGTDKQLGPVFQDEAWIAYRTKWNEFPQNEIVGEVPLQLDLYVVDVCNLKCPMCTRQIFTPGTGYMDFHLVKKILDQATDYGLYAFNISGLGEPTLYPNLFEVIRYAKEKGVIDVNMHTNGTRLSSDFNRHLIESGIDRLIISLDSADKERYESIRVGAKFEKVYAGVEDLIRQRDDHPTTRPHIKANFIEMDEEDHAEKDKFISYWKNKANRIGILRYLDCQTGEETLHYKDNYTQDDNFCCPELWRRLTILSDGTATLCTRDMKKKGVIGNINEQSVSEIWIGEKMQHARNLHRSGRFKEISLCSDCPDSYDTKKGLK
ncbi:MAG: radical SAM/SPASM domain-containing protein [Syntrophus sp. (in: bacteria)]